MRVNIVRLRGGGKKLMPFLINKTAAGVDGHLFLKNGLASFHYVDDPGTPWIFPALRDAAVVRMQNDLLLIDGSETVMDPGAKGSRSPITQYRQTWQCMTIAALELSSTTPQETWLAEFVNELYLNLRPDIERKFAQKIAINMWPRHKDLKPAEAAKRWAAARAPR